MRRKNFLKEFRGILFGLILTALVKLVAHVGTSAADVAGLANRGLDRLAQVFVPHEGAEDDGGRVPLDGLESRRRSDVFVATRQLLETRQSRRVAVVRACHVRGHQLVLHVVLVHTVGQHLHEAEHVFFFIRGALLSANGHDDGASQEGSQSEKSQRSQSQEG